MAGRSPYRRVVRTKLVPPVPADGLIVRDRVMARLSPERRFTLVSAMPGYGKTAVVRQWIDTVDMPVAWLSLDWLDQESITFWSHLLAALGNAVPALDDEPMQLLRERGAGDPVFLNALVAQLVETDVPVLMVLDGLGGPIDRSTLEGLTVLVERAGEALRLAATTRADPPLPLARWHSLGWLSDLREHDLRFTDGEAVAIAQLTDTSVRAADDVIALNERVGGWPIGLHMALLARPAGTAQPSSGADLLDGSRQLLANYLVGEVLDAMSDDEREVALALSVLEWFDPDMCSSFLGAKATDVVRRLLGRGMFLSVVDARTGAMRFHDLFRELMEMELGWRDPAERLRLHRHAALLWRARGDLLTAYHHLAAIDETDRAHELLVGPALELVDGGDLDSLARFAQQLPVPRQVSSVHLALDLAVVAYYADGTASAARWCTRAAELLDEQPRANDDQQLRAQLNAVRCAIALFDADLDAALAGVEPIVGGRAACGRPTSSKADSRSSRPAACWRPVKWTRPLRTSVDEEPPDRPDDSRVGPCQNVPRSVMHRFGASRSSEHSADSARFALRDVRWTRTR